MRKKTFQMFVWSLFGALVILFTNAAFVGSGRFSPIAPKDKIQGISVAATENPIDSNWVPPLQKMNAEWVAMLPYALTYPKGDEVVYDVPEQYWGEKPEGLRQTTRQAKARGMKVMYKPQVWIPGNWPGGFDPGSEEGWQRWERSYELMLLKLAVLAESEGVELICIGTEYRIAVRERTDFWRQLIAKIRRVYHGKLTYAANWDDFHTFPLWSEMDYIGVDAYFPLNGDRTPSIEDLREDWLAPLRALEYIARFHGKRILFTEYGYKSIHHTAWKQWEFEHIKPHRSVNLKAQYNAYQALFESVWGRNWFAGGFIWKWDPYHKTAGGERNSDYTPQHKPAAQLIRHWYRH